jgi:hypothetical protein
MKLDQADLFDVNPMPAGFRYAPELIDVAEEARFVEDFAHLPCAPRRRVSPVEEDSTQIVVDRSGS